MRGDDLRAPAASAASRPVADGPRPKARLRHGTDWLALLSGLLFIGIGIRYLDPDRPDPLVIVPILLVGLGFAGFVAIIAKAVRRR